jgi:hypothetical protein
VIFHVGSRENSETPPNEYLLNLTQATSKGIAAVRKLLTLAMSNNESTSAHNANVGLSVPSLFATVLSS